MTTITLPHFPNTNSHLVPITLQFITDQLYKSLFVLAPPPPNFHVTVDCIDVMNVEDLRYSPLLGV
uniref:Uncharacterized protein n=1 Tax=Arion vulgaris TaxID=1028688 RepID=A0A0B7AJZ9_9EUPU